MNKKKAVRATPAKKKKAPEAIAEIGRKSGQVMRPLKFQATQVVQSMHSLYIFKAKASVLYDALSINRKIESKDKDEGYQRVLSLSRVQAITRYVMQKNLFQGQSS